LRYAERAITTRDGATSVAVRADGRIVVLGSAADPTMIALAAFLPDGTPDGSFGIGGVVVTNVGTSLGATVRTTSDGLIVAAGGCLLRYLNDGRLDQTFGGAGSSCGSSYLVDVVQTPDGDFVGGGGSSGIYLVARDASGQPDDGFGSHGQTVSPPENGLRVLGVQSDGGILAATSIGASGGIALALARFRHDGSLDPTFGTGGIVTTLIGSEFIGLRAAYPYAMVVDAQDRVTLVAAARALSGYDWALARYLVGPTGSVDSTTTTTTVTTTTLAGCDADVNDRPRVAARKLRTALRRLKSARHDAMLATRGLSATCRDSVDGTFAGAIRQLEQLVP
jgi:uncharacterized delta-60 repeat protein